MTKQLSFELPVIDRQSTKTAIEAAFEQYRMCLLTTPEEHMPKVTQTFSIIPTFSNSFHSSTEESAIKNVDGERFREKFMKKIQKSVNRLSYEERAVIIKGYMTHENIFDYEVYQELGMSERKYYRVKSRAFYKLAFMMKADKYFEEIMQ